MSQKSPISILGIFVWLLGALFFLYEFFLRTFVGSLAHQIIPDLNLNAETFSIISSAYYVAYALMQIPVGVLADKFGVKKIMVFAVLACALATLLFAHTANFTQAVVARFLMGLGSSFAFICLLVIAITWFPRKYFGFFSGTSQFVGTMGPLLAGGPLIAFMQHYHESWRVALSSVAVAGVILAVLVFLFVKNKPRDKDQPLIMLSIETPFKSRLLRLARNKQAWCIALFSCTCYASIALLAAVWGTEYLETKGLSQLAAANMISVAWLGYAIACPLVGALSDMFKRRKPFLIGSACIGLVSTANIVYLPQTSLWVYAVLFFGLGVAAAGQNLGFATISEHVDLETRATALGLNNAAITLLGAAVPPLVSYFIFLSAGQNSAHLVSSNFIVGLSVMPALYLISILTATFFIKETFCKPQKEYIKLVVK